MSIKNWPGGRISDEAPVPSGPYENSTASGVWTLEQQAYWEAQGLWPTAGEVNPDAFIENLFQTWLYTGNGSTQTITNGIDLAGKGGLVWSKRRSTAESHVLLDTARNNGSSALYSDATSGQQTAGNFIQSFNSNGYSIGSNSLFNASGSTNVSWTFRKQPKFFDVVTYTGAGSVDYAHALGSVPGFALYKATNGTSNWNCVCRKSDGTYELLQLNTTASTFATYANAAAAGLTSTTFNPSPAGSATPSTQFVAYLFAHNAGGFGLTGTDNVISCGSYTGNGSTSGPSITLGYEPQWILIKDATDAGPNWAMFDNMRGIATGGTEQRLYANTSGAEATTGGNDIDLTATGFDIKTDLGYLNTSGSTFIYIAIRRGPMKVPTDGTSVFAPVLSSTTPSVLTSGFPVDMALSGTRTPSGYEKGINDRLRGFSDTSSGTSPWLVTPTTAAEAANTGAPSYYSAGNTSVTVGAYLNGTTLANYLFRRAPGFFDEVCYTGTGATTTQTHNLGVVPELIIAKSRSFSAAYTDWMVYTSKNGSNKIGFLDLDAAFQATPSNVWPSDPTASVFTVGDSPTVNRSSYTYVAYLFATCPGVSKVGSYTGTAATLQINCGFTAGARFVLIKRTDSTGDWYVWDSARGIVAGDDPYLLLNSTAAEVTNTDYVDTYSAGFEITSTAPAAINASGGSFIFLAIA